MRLSEFDRAVADEFGAQYGSTLLRDLALAQCGFHTAQDALAHGIPVRDVWAALCEEMAVPPARRHGVGLSAPPR